MLRCKDVGGAAFICLSSTTNFSASQHSLYAVASDHVCPGDRADCLPLWTVEDIH